MEWNEKGKFLCSMSENHAVLRVREKGSQDGTCGEEISARESKVVQKKKKKKERNVTK